MGSLIVMVLLVLAGLLAAWALGPRLLAGREPRGRDVVRPGIGGLQLVLGAVLVVLAIAATGITQIEAGTVGVIRRFGAVTGEILQPGIQWVTPIVASVDVVDTRVRSVSIENYTAASLEQQDLFMTLTLNYHVDPAAAPRIIQDIGQDFEAKIVTPRFLDIPKSVTDDYRTAVVLGARDEIRDKASQLLRTELGKFGFVVDNIALENFGYSPEYNAAIEQKQIEQQKVETEKQKLEQAKIAAQTAKEQAIGEANAQIERARGEAEANRLVSESLTDEILLNRYIEKLAPGVKAILVPTDGGFIFDLGQVLDQAQQ